jgi:hypothetical protein
VQHNAAYRQTDTHDCNVVQEVVWFLGCAKGSLLISHILTVVSVRLEQSKLPNGFLNINYTLFRV